MSQPSNPSLGFTFVDPYQQPFDSDYDVPYQTSPADFLPTHPQLETGLQMDGSYLPLGGQMDNMSLNWQQQSYQNNVIGCYGSDGLPDIGLPTHNLANNSPTDTCPARSLTSSSSDGWVGVGYRPYQSMDAFQDPHNGSISNPEQTLHLRTFSDSSHSDGEHLSQYSGSSYVEISHAVGSPGSDSFGDFEFYNVCPREPSLCCPNTVNFVRKCKIQKTAVDSVRRIHHRIAVLTVSSNVVRVERQLKMRL